MGQISFDLKKLVLSQHQKITLNVFRLLAAQLVFFGHFFSLSKIHLPYLPLGTQIPIQSFGVVIFFVLSGLLISHTCVNKLSGGGYLFSDYFIDRFARIFTLYFPVLLLVAVLDLYIKNYLYDSVYTWKNFFGTLFMLQNYPLTSFATHIFGSARQFWTISIEWWFYMIFGWVVFRILRVRIDCKAQMLAYHVSLKRLNLFNLIPAILLLPVPLANIYGRGKSLTLDWLGGFLIAFILPYITLSRPTALVCAFVSLALVPFWFSGHGIVLLLSIVGFILFFLFSLHLSKDSSFLAHLYSVDLIKRFINLGARYSYSLYLTHFTLLELLLSRLHGISHLALFFIAFLVCNIVALLFYVVFDMQYRRLALFLKNKGKVFRDSSYSSQYQ